MRVGLIQITSGADRAANLAAVKGLIRAAAAEGAEFVSTPETMNVMDADKARLVASSVVEAADETLMALRTLAAELKIWLHLGSLILAAERDGKPTGRLINRSFIIAPNGAIATRYDKIHLFDVVLTSGERYRESALYDAGNQAVVCPLGDFNLGLSICYDLRFPSLYQALTESGADVLLVPAAFTRSTGQAHWMSLLRARAIETGSYVIAAAQTGDHEPNRSEGGRKTYGHSLVIDPWGEVLWDGGEAVGYYVFDMDKKNVLKARRQIPTLSHRRPFRVRVMDNYEGSS